MKVNNPTTLNIDNAVVDTFEEDFTISGDELDQTLDHAFKLLEQERLQKLKKGMKRTIFAKIIPLCNKVLDLDNGSTLELNYDTLDTILVDMINLGEREPYGVLGGTLFVNFGKNEFPSSSENNNSSGLRLTKIGRFPLNTDTRSHVTSTFELHLTLYPSTHVKHKMANLMRKMQGKPPLLMVDHNFTLIKKKLYRSSCSIK